MEQTERNQSIAVIRDVLAKEFFPSAIFLFGSHAWGTPDARSDIDNAHPASLTRPPWPIKLLTRE